MNLDFLHLASLYEYSTYKRAKAGQYTYRPVSIEYPEYYHSLLSYYTQFTELLQGKGEVYMDNRQAESSSAGYCNDYSSKTRNSTQNTRNTQIPTQSSDTKTSITHPINISIIVPLDCIDYMSAHATPSATPVLNNAIDLHYLAHLCSKFHSDTASITTADYAYYHALYDFNLHNDKKIPGDVISNRNDVTRNPPLGNLLMCSAPGKKVRLGVEAGDGELEASLASLASLAAPATPRAPVDRCILLDLLRIRDSGCTLLACCLDDHELSLLGTSWEQYSYSAARLGLSILRFPMPEGLHPPNIHDFYDRIDLLLHEYTFAGRNVLAHCRGGVGRASLIACAWILRMGLVKGLLTPSSQLVTSEYNHTLHITSLTIEIVRYRRSVKAVETYEQVRFLFDFVSLLRQKAGVVS
ncbi:hypothetical protein E3P86_00023 [Wallemia ichthyophaga]|uniref:Tyrosine specific protein phosphatases domain-containing protein n=1 Tax=Wallemia ichthyophaga TaxID=245174 RepID=A0A4T0JJ09_WALIC|nr:hypothetical protein E3P86_00023 [Wallemia ichthyophaga]